MFDCPCSEVEKLILAVIYSGNADYGFNVAIDAIANLARLEKNLPLHSYNSLAPEATSQVRRTFLTLTLSN
jgi:hypothetical protein